jgi:hypothetical protein
VQRDLAYTHGDASEERAARSEQLKRLPNWGKKRGGKKARRQPAAGR